MSTDPTTAPVPTPGVHWWALLDFFRSLGSLPLWHVARGGGGLAFSAAKYAVQSLPYVASAIVIVAALHFMGCSPIPLPNPPAPVPADPLTASLQAAYAQDADADRAKSLAFLQTIYPVMAANVPSPPPATNTQAFAWMKSKVEGPGGLTMTQVVNLRKAVAVELSADFGNDASTPIDAAKFTAALSKIGSALKGVR